MKKKIMFIIVLLVMVVITGCSNKKDSVIIYTCMEDNRNQLLKQMVKEEFKDINVKVQPIATGNSAAKLKNEGTKIEADIILDLETSHMQSLEYNFAIYLTSIQVCI